MEHGLDARHAEILPDGSAVSRRQSQCVDVWFALRVEREFHPAVFARRSGPHEGLAAEQDAGHDGTEVRDATGVVWIHVGASGEEVVVYGRGVWAVAGVDRDGESRLALARGFFASRCAEPHSRSECFLRLR